MTNKNYIMTIICILGLGLSGLISCKQRKLSKPLGVTLSDSDQTLGDEVELTTATLKCPSTNYTETGTASLSGGEIEVTMEVDPERATSGCFLIIRGEAKESGTINWHSDPGVVLGSKKSSVSSDGTFTADFYKTYIKK